MSIEQARRFIARVHVDDDLRTRVLAEADVERRMELIRHEGFDCTADEIAAALVQLSVAILEGEAPDEVKTPAGPDDRATPWTVFYPN